MELIEIMEAREEIEDTESKAHLERVLDEYEDKIQRVCAELGRLYDGDHKSNGSIVRKELEVDELRLVQRLTMRLKYYYTVRQAAVDRLTTGRGLTSD